MIFATPPMRNQRFHCPGPLQKWCKISSTKGLCNQTPPNSSIFNLRAPLDGNMNRKGLQKGSFWGGREHQKQSWGWKFKILGGSGCRVFFWSDFAPFLEGSWTVKTLISTPQNGPSFSLNGCQNGFPKRHKLARILSNEISRNYLNETNSGK